MSETENILQVIKRDEAGELDPCSGCGTFCRPIEIATWDGMCVDCFMKRPIDFSMLDFSMNTTDYHSPLIRFSALIYVKGYSIITPAY